MSDAAEMNRLTGLGLPAIVALKIIQGELEEEAEVESQRMAREAAIWAAESVNRMRVLEPQWDLDQAHFHYALDGCKAGEFHRETFVLEFDPRGVHDHLHPGCVRDGGPWEARYESKSAGIAYRWAMSLPVTPPLIFPLDNKVAIAGGYHRYYLALHYRARSMPFLIEQQHFETMKSIVPMI